MFKPNNVIKSLGKLNKMDKKQAYTYGAIGVVVIVLLIMFASFLGNAEDASFDGFDSQGYDLANSPFVTERAEEMLLASAYPDMQENNAEVIYTAAEKAARQEEEGVEEEENSSESSGESGGSSYGSSYGSSGGYSGRGGGSPTQVGQMGNASMSHGSGSGIGGTWGSPRVDTNPLRHNDREKDPIATLKKENARRALSQFANASRAGAQLKDGKSVNMKRALQGGNVLGAAMNSDGTVDLSRVDGNLLDTNAPQQGSSDLSALKDNVKKAVDDKKKDDDKKNDDDKKDWMEKFTDGLLEAGIEAIKSGITNFLSGQMKSWNDSLTETRDLNRQAKGMWNEKSMTSQTAEYMASLYPKAKGKGPDGNELTGKDYWNSYVGKGNLKTALNGSDVKSGNDGWTKGDFKSLWRTYKRTGGGNGNSGGSGESK